MSTMQKILNYETRWSLDFSQTFGTSGLWYNECDFEWNKKIFRSWFVKGGYPEKLADSKIWKVKFNIGKTNRKNKSKNGVPLQWIPSTFKIPLGYHQEKYLSA